MKEAIRLNHKVFIAERYAQLAKMYSSHHSLTLFEKLLAKRSIVISIFMQISRRQISVTAKFR